MCHPLCNGRHNPSMPAAPSPALDTPRAPARCSRVKSMRNQHADFVLKQYSTACCDDLTYLPMHSEEHSRVAKRGLRISSGHSSRVTGGSFTASTWMPNVCTLDSSANVNMQHIAGTKTVSRKPRRRKTRKGTTSTHARSNCRDASFCTRASQ